MTTGDGRDARAVVISDERDIDVAFAALGVGPGPAVLLIGGASNIEPDEVDRLERFFTRAFVPAVGRFGAVVLTGGTDEGVMRFVGSANIRADRPVRLVGVAPFAKVTAPGSTGTTPLARGHAEFVLVPGDEWGDESAILRAMASKLSGGTALIMLVNGGEVASDEAAHGLAGGSGS